MADFSTLIVRLHNEVIGTLTHVGGERSLFAFTDAYINNKDRATLSLSVKDTFGQLLTDFQPYRIKLMPFFSNLLPEGHLRTYLADTARVHPEREFFLLWALGRDLPGAITVTAENDQARPESSNALTGQTMVKVFTSKTLPRYSACTHTTSTKKPATATWRG